MCELLEAMQSTLHFNLNFTGVVVYYRAHFGQGTGPILMDSVSCNGLESKLLDCSYDSITTEDTHAEDAGVHCPLG